jgi:hypothetical protein
MKTTLIIPDQIFRELKRRAARRRVTLSAVVAEALLKGLDETGGAISPSDPLPVYSMGAPRADLADRDALYRVMEGR